MKVITIKQNSNYPESMKNPFFNGNMVTTDVDRNVAYRRGQDSVFNHAIQSSELTKDQVIELITELWKKPENRIPIAEAAGIPVDEFIYPTGSIKTDGMGVKYMETKSLREHIEKEK